LFLLIARTKAQPAGMRRQGDGDKEGVGLEADLSHSYVYALGEPREPIVNGNTVQ
jgi:hypothetical protein